MVASIAMDDPNAQQCGRNLRHFLETYTVVLCVALNGSPNNPLPVSLFVVLLKKEDNIYNFAIDLSHVQLG